MNALPLHAAVRVPTRAGVCDDRGVRSLPLLAFTLLVGCGGAGHVESRAARAAPDAPFLPGTWEELEVRVDAVYRGRLVYREGPGDPEWCEIAEERIDASGPAGAFCGDAMRPEIGAGWAPPPGAPAWIVTRATAGVERPYIVHACEGECTDLPRDAILSDVRCFTLRGLQTGERPADQVCASDDDCESIEAMCYGAAVSRSLAPLYRAALARWWSSECLPPGAGMCPPSMRVARCEAGTCVSGWPGRSVGSR